MSFITKIKTVGIIPLLYKLKYKFSSNNAEILDLCSRYGAYDYLKRYARSVGQYKLNHTTSGEKIIWTCWLQGEENAPLIVKRCLESIRKYSSGYKVVVLNSDNIKDFIKVPEFIEDKHNSGIIPHAHYTDIVRLLLLIKYGGVWIDSTIMLFSPLPSYVTSFSLFAFKGDNTGHVLLANNFLASSLNHPILCGMRDMLMAYWARENRLVSYSLFHLSWTWVVSNNAEYYKYWQDVPRIPSINEYLLLSELNNDYDDIRLNYIINMCPIQKLSYKFKEYKIDTSKQGSFYDCLINRYQQK